MANRITYMLFLRKLHFIVSIFLLIFTFFYVLTGFIAIQEDWFPHGKPTVSKEHFPLTEIPDTSSSAAFIREMRHAFEIQGRASELSVDKWGYGCNFARPGLVKKVFIAHDSETIQIETIRQMTIGRVSSRLHHLRGFSSGIIYILWSIFYDLAAIAFVLYAITGILIWYKLRKPMKYGWLILGTVLVFVISNILKLMR